MKNKIGVFTQFVKTIHPKLPNSPNKDWCLVIFVKKLSAHPTKHQPGPTFGLFVKKTDAKNRTSLEV